jgi:hypothetical protein
MRKAITTHRRRERQSISARRSAAYERPVDDAVLSERFFDSRVKLAAVSPETALMYAVLEDAFLCFHKQFEADRRDMLSARQAEDWFFKDSSRWLFSFPSVCDALGLEPRYIRQKLKHWTPFRLDAGPGKP